MTEVFAVPMRCNVCLFPMLILYFQFDLLSFILCVHFSLCHVRISPFHSTNVHLNTLVSGKKIATTMKWRKKNTNKQNRILYRRHCEAGLRKTAINTILKLFLCFDVFICTSKCRNSLYVMHWQNEPICSLNCVSSEHSIACSSIWCFITCIKLNYPQLTIFGVVWTNFLFVSSLIRRCCFCKGIIETCWNVV